MAKFDFGEFGSNLLQSGANSLLSGAISSLFGGKAQKRATEASLGLMREQQMMQRQNNLDSALLMRQSKEKAGFNVNADGSISPSLTPPSASQSPVAPDIKGGMSLLPMSQVALNEAQARDLNATAGLKERRLKGETEADKVYGAGDFSVKCARTGNFIEVEVLNEKREPVTTKEGFDAVKDVSSWLWRDFDQMKLDNLKLNFESKVMDLRLADNELIKMVADMQGEEFKNLVEDTAVKRALKEVYIQDKQLKIDEHELNVLRKSSEENSSLGVLLGKLSSSWEEGDILGSLGTLIKLLFVSVITTISGNVSFSKGSNKSSVTSTSHSTVNSTSHNTNRNTSNSTSHVYHHKK